MLDHHFEALKRRLSSDPENVALQCEVLNAQARLEGPEVLLRALFDRALWQTTPETIQDAIIKLVAQQLGPAYQQLETQRFTCHRQSQRLGCFRHLATGLVLHLIPGGEFLMGSDYEFITERPEHSARVAPFLMGRFPVRQAIWRRLESGRDSRRQADWPIHAVSWQQCQDWLERAGGGLRLPSEAEWEYACRAGTMSRYFWGHSMKDSYCWYRQNSGFKVRSVLAHRDHGNAFGLVDMLGHVREWCQDSYIPDYQSGPHDQSPRIQRSERHVVRGGCLYLRKEYCRSSSRAGQDNVHLDSEGLRVACSLEF